MLDAKEAASLCDENTIAVVAIFGSTYTGEYEPIEELNAELDALNQRTGWDVHMHVDAASGGFVAPFITPELKWDFRLPWVRGPL
jgi:glutamate decarboxylase